MEPLRFAFHYFTNLPSPGEPDWNEKTAAASLAWLPLTGLILGMCLAALGLAFISVGFPQYPLLRAMLIAALELWIGGARFVAGFSRSCDGLFSGLGKARSLDIIKESHTGTPGALALAAYLPAKLLLLTELSYSTGDFIFLLLFYPCWARWAASFAACQYPAAQEEGMAYFFKTGQKPVYIILSSAFVLLALIVMPRFFYPAALVSFVAVLFGCSQVQMRLGGQTEETFGFAAIVAELSFLLFAVISAAAFTFI
ncbi:MAG: adenosylcobinamide-GDP ribazoletransferase [Clostridiales bacterium]|nr:adenosylcobinamide-GDP ribazoletransferase [Clostridiales bacterium]